MTGKIYDTLKWIALVVLPALVFFIEGVAEIWGITCGSQVSATIALLEVFLGTILQISSAKYKAKKDK